MSLKRFELPTLKCHRSMSKGDIRFTFTKETDDDETLEFFAIGCFINKVRRGAAPSPENGIPST